MTDSERRIIELERSVADLEDRLKAAGQSATEGHPARISELEVERITVVAPDGTPRVVLTNKERAPDPVIAGRTGQRSGGNSAGLYFFNERGDECGGLIFGVSETPGAAPYGYMSLTFDRLGGDQVIGIQYGEDGEGRAAALRVWDRPQMTPELRAQIEGTMQLPEAERKAAFAEMQRQNLFGAERLYVGRKRDGSVVLEMSDDLGRPRLRAVVRGDGGPAVELLDELGRVVRSIGDAV